MQCVQDRADVLEQYGNYAESLEKQASRATAEASNSQSSQKSLESFAVRRGSQAKSEEITSAICDMIALDLMSISTIEGTGFRKLMKLLQLEYSVPGRTLMMAMAMAIPSVKSR